MLHTLWPLSSQDKQMNFWQESQIWHERVASASEASESFTLCPLYDGGHVPCLVR